jgi:Xaa-Pro aminopeptidase
MKPEKIARAQEHLMAASVDGWLLYDFHRCNDLACDFLEIAPGAMATRRFYYWIPARGKPVKLVHAIEEGILDAAPGGKHTYASWESMEAQLRRIIGSSRTIAMEYSPRCALPYVAKVDAGTVELVRSLGVEVVSSAPFLLYFTSLLSPEQQASQRRAASACAAVVAKVWDWIRENWGRRALTEWDVLCEIENRLSAKGLVAKEPPIVAVNEHSADPHFTTKPQGRSLQSGDLLLIDLWAKEPGDGAVFGDLTRVAYLGEHPTEEMKEVFRAVRKAQKAAIALVRQRMEEKKELQGWEVDRAARREIRDAGYGEFFIHRTGHNIGTALHGSGTHMDDLEMHDVRPVLPNTCFSIEPGVYLPKRFGIRLESDVLIDGRGRVEVTGGEQDELIGLLHRS